MGTAGGNARGDPCGEHLSRDRRDRRPCRADGHLFAAAYLRNDGDLRPRDAVGEQKSAVCGRRLRACWLRRKGWHVPAAHLAAQSSPGCARAGKRAALRPSDKIRDLRRACSELPPVCGRSRVGQAHSHTRRDHDAARRGSRAAFGRPQTHARLLFRFADRVYPDRHRHDGAARA